MTQLGMATLSAKLPASVACTIAASGPDRIGHVIGPMGKGQKGGGKNQRQAKKHFQ